MSLPLAPRQLLLAIAGLSIGAVGAALVSQHVFDMQPCPWCVLQRLIFVLIGAAALVGAAAWGSSVGRFMSSGLLLALGASGIAAALWHYFVATSSASCNLTLADRIISALQLDALLPLVFQATANCADASVKLFGVAYPLWSLALFAVIEAAVVGLWIGDRRGGAARA